MRRYPWTRSRCLPASIACTILLAACATTDTTPASDPTQLLTLDEAVGQVANNVSDQLKKDQGVLEKLHASVVRPPSRRVIVVDPMVDGTSGQQTALSAELQRRLLARMSKQDLEVIALTSQTIARAQLVMTATIALETTGGKDANSTSSPARIQLALTDLRTGMVVAQASARVKNAEFDTTPSSFDQDSPAVLEDSVVRGYIQTAATAAGNEAYSNYLKHLAASTAIADGTSAYNKTEYVSSLRYFQAALAAPSGEQLRALNGTYLADVKLGRMSNAEDAFARIVAFGITRHDLGVKFLFNPRTTEFWSDPKISGAYDMWLRQIARATVHAGTCVEVIGHASHTGAEMFNEKLSEQRAARIEQKLLGETPGLSGHITTRGVGFRENIIGTGTDDARDALDRRVSFQFRDCK
jgi:hypothetical protein